MGNRASKSDSSTGSESYGYDAANRLTSRTIGGSAHSVTSDANGNTLTDSERTNVWDSQNRLISCASSAGGSATTSAFTYGSDGLRRRGTVTASDGTSTRTDYIYDGTMMVEQIVGDYNAEGVATHKPIRITYMQGPSGPLYRKSSAVADPSWYVYDGLGSVVGEVDVNGNMTAGKDFDVYGLTRNVTGTPTTRQGFVGQLGHESDDETGLIYMRARYYDPGTGRFTSQDSARNGINWYSYCNNNPVNAIDPDGKSWRQVVFLTGCLLSYLAFDMLAVAAISRTPWAMVTATAIASAAAILFSVAVAGLTNTEQSLFGEAADVIALISATVKDFGALVQRSLGLPGITLAMGAMFTNLLIDVSVLESTNNPSLD